MAALEKQTTPSEAGAQAALLFDGGLYCAESVVGALARRQGVDPGLLIAAATGFCSGLSRTGHTCGAVSGAVMAIGLAKGRMSAAQKVDATYTAVQSLIMGFEKEFGSIACPELLGCRLGTPEGQRIYKERRLIQRCRAYTRRAAELTAEILEQERDASKRML